jgi:hypothetical protein
MGETLEAIGDRISPERMVERRKAAVGQGFRRMREAVMGSADYVEPAVQRAQNQAQSAATSTIESARTVGQSVQHAPAAVAEHTAGNPLAAGLIAFGAGLLAATAFPQTRTEQRLVETAQPQLDKVKDELHDAGHDISAGARDHAKSALEQTTSAGKDAASTMVGEARESARMVTDDVKGTSQT